MLLKFAPNISTLFTECKNMEDRYEAVKKHGFEGVECQFPYSVKVDVIGEARENSGLEHVLINSYPGNIADGQFGFATHVEDEDFKKSIDLTLQYAKALKCKRVHVIAGMLSPKCEFSKIEEIYIKNLRYAAEQFEMNDITGLIEPICDSVKPNYFLCSYKKALEYVKKIDSPHLKLLLDVFHMQMICGNLTATIKEVLPYSGHVQISQAPHRFEPSIPGEINYQYILALLSELKYDGWIGLEYFPSGNSNDSIQWINEYADKLN